MALFDVWRGPSLGEGRRSLGFRARSRALDRTLTEQDVAEVRDRVVLLSGNATALYCGAAELQGEKQDSKRQRGSAAMLLRRAKEPKWA